MKAFAELPCDNIAIISKKIYQYIQSKNCLDQNIEGWHFLDTVDLINFVPELLEFFSKYKLYVRHSAVTILTKELALHVDPLPVIAKINFPVLNTEGWSNIWYSLPQEYLDSTEKIITKFGDQKEDIGQLPESIYTLEAELPNLKLPIVFHSRLPHKVVPINPIGSPRIIASFTFYNQPTHLLS